MTTATTTAKTTSQTQPKRALRIAAQEPAPAAASTASTANANTANANTANGASANANTKSDAKPSTTTDKAAAAKPSVTDAAESPACAKDVDVYCQREANVLSLLREAPDVVEPMKLVAAARKVHMCMVTHADVLSTPCVDSLSGDTTTAATTGDRTTGAASVPAAKTPLDNDAADEDSSMEITIYYSHHHDGAGHALRSGGALAANHVQAGSSSATAVLANPLLWVFVLPFFVVGLYVSGSRAATYFRRRREERRIESKQYMPVS